jgi:AraC-like DNA-binding protein
MRQVTPADASKGILDFPNALEHFRLQRHEPAADLLPWIESYWVVAWDLPEGQVHRQTNLSHASINAAFEPEGAFLYGVPQRTFVRDISGSGSVFGVKFRPGGFFPFNTGRSLRGLTGKRVPLADALGEGVREWSRRMAEARAGQEQAVIADALWRNLRDACPQRFTERPTQATFCAERLVSDHSMLSVAMAASAMGVSIRSLERLFTAQVGIGPKEVIRRFRLQEAAERLLRQPQEASGRIAMDLGYFDQAHFIRDFKAVVGVPPEVYRQRQRRA